MDSSSFKSIVTVPTAVQFVDIVLNQTQRKTATVIHKSYAIQRIRSFYIKKIVFATTEFTERLQRITNQFPRIEDIHPFYSDLLNILYDRNQYKMALGHISSVNSRVKAIGSEYKKMVVHAETLARCKHLKKSCFGRIVTYIKKLKDSLDYLEQVRQNLNRLPEISLAGRTLLIAGCPNAGKSSFLNKITRACVDVQPYAFTTKNLYVGHFDYNYLRFQAIDTPGILDRELDDRNAIEMQSIAALAHLNALVLFFIDISEACGFKITDQVNLFNSISKLAVNPIIVLSKADLVSEELRSSIMNSTADGHYSILNPITSAFQTIFISNLNDDNIELLKGVACDLIINGNSAKKEINNNVQEVLNRINTVCASEKWETVNEPIRKIEPLAFEYGIPEFYNGKNVSDFLDSNILERIEALDHVILNNKDGFRKFDLLSKEDEQTVTKIRHKIVERKIIHQENMRSATNKNFLNRKKGKTEILPRPITIGEKPPIYVMPKQKVFQAKLKHVVRAGKRRNRSAH